MLVAIITLSAGLIFIFGAFRSFNLVSSSNMATDDEYIVSTSTPSRGDDEKLVDGEVPSSETTKIMAWVFPSTRICEAKSEYSDGRHIDVLKPEYFTLAEDGRLTLLTEASRGCNGYSKKNVEHIRAYAAERFVTVSGAVDSTYALVGSASLRAEAVSKLVSFVLEEQFTGVEIDFEDFGNWDAQLYADYKIFLKELGEALHKEGRMLMVDVPPVSSSQDQSYFLISYKDIAKLPVDYIVVMAYDYQFDEGAGAPIAPNDWVKRIVENAKRDIGDIDRIVIGIPAYSYRGITGSFSLTRGTYDDLSTIEGFSTAPRDPLSYERIWEHRRVSYVYIDSEGLALKRALIESYGITQISVWALGGNQWFPR
jgi:spore germination protein YaaH